MPDQAPAYKLKDSRFRPREAVDPEWTVSVEDGTPYSALFTSEYWDFVKDRIQPNAYIYVEPDDQSYTAILKVRSISNGQVRVAEFYRKTWKDEGEMPKSLVSKYEVKWAGPVHKFRVKRMSDGSVVQHGFANEGEANVWLVKNAAALERPEAA